MAFIQDENLKLKENLEQQTKAFTEALEELHNLILSTCPCSCH